MSLVGEVSEGILVSQGFSGIIQFGACAMGVDVEVVFLFVKIGLLKSEFDTLGLLLKYLAP